MARKFFKQKVSSIKGPRKPINVLSDLEEIKEEEARKILDDFFVKDVSNAEELKDKAWDYILKGRSVTVNETCLTCKP